MDNQHTHTKLIAPFLLGLGLALGASTAATAFPDNSRIYSDSHSNYHHRSFRNIQPFRSLNVTPKYYIPLPNSHYRNRDRYHNHHDRNDRYYYDKEYHNRERRVHRRGYRVPADTNYDREYHDSDRTRVRRVYRRDYRVPTENSNSSDRYIRIRVR